MREGWLKSPHRGFFNDSGPDVSSISILPIRRSAKILPARELSGRIRCQSVSHAEHPHYDEAGDHCREQGSNHEDDPASAFPQISEAGGLNEHVRKVSGTVSHIRGDGQQEYTQSKIDGDHRLRMRIARNKIGNHNDCERHIVEHSARFPESDSVGKEVAQLCTVHANSLMELANGGAICYN